MIDRPILKHALSIDVEEWNNAALLMVTGRVEPPGESVYRNTMLLLELVESYGTKATWFVLGEVAEAYPRLVRRVVDAGHEVGVHGYHHHRVFELTPEAHFDSLVRAKKVIEDIAGVAARGYRAVAMSIGDGTWHALDSAARAGFMYDSSLFPFRGPVYGTPDSRVEPHWRQTLSGAWIYEVPLTVLEVGPLRLPGCGGGYLRHFPLAYTRLLLMGLEHQRRSAVFYLHPYELDADRSGAIRPGGMSFAQEVRFARLRHFQYRNRELTETKLRWLLQHHSFAPICEVFALDEQSPPSTGGRAHG